MKRALALALAGLATGCSGYLERQHGGTSVAGAEAFHETDAPADAEAAPSEAPAANGARERSADGAHDIRRWGSALGSPDLDTFLRAALDANYEIAVAEARIRQSAAIADQVRAARMPMIGGQARGTYGSSVRPPFGLRSNSWSVGLSLPVSYEVDLFGRYASSHRAARFEAEASEQDARALAVSVAAQTAESYFDIIAVHARRVLLAQQLATNAAYLELVRERFERGLTSAVDVHQQAQLVAATEAQIALVDGQEALAQSTLSVLLGVPPGPAYAVDAATLPELPSPPPPGTPEAMLERRPDIVAANLRLEAADALVADAVRAQLPALLLDFTPSYDIGRTRYPNADSSDSVLRQDLIRGFNWSAAATLNVPIFDGLRGPALAKERRAMVDVRLAEYRQLYLTALYEIETAIALERQQRLNMAALAEQLELATTTLTVAQERYRQGLSDYLPVLTALATQQSVQLALLDAHRQLISYRIQRYRGLGGATEPER